MTPTTETTEPVLITEMRGPVARLTLNRPDRRNALSHELLRELDRALVLDKAAFYKQRMLDEPAAYDLATRIMTDNAQRADAQEGIRAFLQKR